MIKAAKELYPNAQAIEWDGKKLKIDGATVDHAPLQAREDELRLKDVEEVNKNLEREWIASELDIVRDQIENAEDTNKKVPNLRAYRLALKQYKSDLYMPNVSRPIK